MTENRNSKGQFATGHTSATKKRKKRDSTILAQQLGEGRVSQLVETAFTKAVAGDVGALKLLLDKIFPSVKSEPVRFSLPQIDRPEDLPLLTGAILRAVSEGLIAPDVAAQLSKVVNAHSQAVEVSEQAREIEALKREILIK